MTELLAEDTVTARKAHRCDDCFATINPGETYNRQKCLSDGRVDTWKRCAPCTGIAQVVWDYWEKFDGDEIGPDDFWEWAHEEQAKDPRALAYLVRRGVVAEEPQPCDPMSAPGPTITRNANLSADGLYRYSLHREWRDLSDPSAMPRWLQFVMLNPSTADGTTDDPTIRRCIGFARSWGATGIAVVNLYAYRATSPADLWKADDPVGPENDETLARFFAMAARYGHPIVAAWGAHARPDRVAEVLQIPGAERLQALGVTKAGAPRHPLYMPRDVRPAPWPAKAVTQ